VRDDVSSAERTLASTRTEIAQLERQRATFGTDETAAKRAEGARKEAELAQTKAQAELSAIKGNVAATQDELIRLQRLKAAIGADEETARRVEAQRAEVEKRLAAVRIELDSVQRQASNESQRRDTARLELEALRKEIDSLNSTANAPSPGASPQVAPRRSPSKPRPPQQPIPINPRSSP
jgi:chromosome segregation ATPase